MFVSNNAPFFDLMTAFWPKPAALLLCTSVNTIIVSTSNRLTEVLFRVPPEPLSVVHCPIQGKLQHVFQVCLEVAFHSGCKGLGGPPGSIGPRALPRLRAGIGATRHPQGPDQAHVFHFTSRTGKTKSGMVLIVGSRI
jgi:hypothetical protein